MHRQWWFVEKDDERWGGWGGDDDWDDDDDDWDEADGLPVDHKWEPAGVREPT